MKSKIVKAGNGWAVLIPKAMLERFGLKHMVELDVEGDQLVIRLPRFPRAGWEKAFREMARRGDDLLIDAERWGASEWEEAEWRW